MNGNITMRSKDSLNAKLAECFVTIGGRRYNFMQMIDFEARWDIDNIEVPILGKVSKGNKPGAASGSYTGTAHYNQSIFRELLLRYKNTGEMEYFTIQVTNEDPTSTVGRQTIVYKDCLINGGILSKFDASGEYLDEELEGTFDDWDMPEKFELLEGME